MLTILFVCTANIARSPMAATLFDKKISEMGLSKQVHVVSAGTWGRDGIPAAAHGQHVMRERGIDISAHRSRIVTQEIIEAADLVLTMERGHKEALRVEFPQKKDKIWLLSEMIGQGYDINDPYGRALQDFEETARELENILEDGLEKIIRMASSDLTNDYRDTPPGLRIDRAGE